MKPYQKAWRNFYVDANLADEWLVRLNGLRIFDLASICEGHWQMEHPYDACPHLNLKMKKQHFPQALVKWDDCKSIFMDVSLVPNGDDMFVHAHLGLDYSFPDASFRNEGFLMEFVCSRRRTTDLSEPWFKDWFLRLVWEIEELDRTLFKSLGSGENPKLSKKHY